MRFFRFPTLLLLALCAISPAFAQTIVRPNVRILPAPTNAKSARITSRSDGGLALSGAVPTLKPGDVLVSGEGQGTLRKVVSVSQSGGTTLVKTSQAQLTDVFQQADIRVQRALTSFESVEPLLPGVRVVGAKSAGKTTRGEVGLPGLSLSLKAVPFKFKKNGIEETLVAELSGEITVSPSVDIGLEISAFSLKKAQFIPRLKVEADVSVAGKATISLADNKQRIAIARLASQPIIVTVGPVPVIFVPILVIYATLEGEIEARGELSLKASLDARAGVIYENGAARGESSVNWTLNVVPNAAVQFEGKITPIHPEFQVLTYGVQGPFLNLDLPEFKAKVKAELNPAQVCLSGEAALQGEGGFRTTILGLKVDAKATLTAYKYAFNEICWQPGGANPLPTPRPTPTPVVAQRLEIRPSAPVVYSGDVVQLDAQGATTSGVPVYIPNDDLTWSSTNETIATVDANGVARGVRAGTCQICVTERRSSLTATALLTVTPGPNVVTHTGATGYGSLREAINYANVFPGTTIVFNIPTSDPGFQNGVFTIGQWDSRLPTLSADTIIDGTTQTIFTGDTAPTQPEINIAVFCNTELSGGTVTLKGLRSLLSILSNGTLNISSDCIITNTLAIVRGGTINNSGHLIFKGDFIAFQQYEGRNSTINNSGVVEVDAGTSVLGTVVFVQTVGSTRLKSGLGGGTLSDSNIFDIRGGTLEGLGTIRGTVVNSGGVVSPGLAGAGVLSIAGDYTQGAGGALRVELGGTNAATPQFDQLKVSGQATLGGTLQVEMLGGYTPSPGDAFRVLSYGSRVGAFAGVSGRAMTPDYQATALVLKEAGTNDILPPTSRVTSPANGARVSMAQASGGAIVATATDEAGGSGVAGVAMVLYRYAAGATPGRYWDGTAFASTLESWRPVTLTNGTWRFTLPTQAQGLTPGQYAVKARATDGAGNVGLSPVVTFSVLGDVTKPQVVVDSPVGGKSYTVAAASGGLAKGRALDETGGSGLSSVSVLLFKYTGSGSSGFYWNGTSFGSTAVVERPVTLSGTGAGLKTWQFRLPTSAQGFGAGRYAMIARARDAAGNLGASKTIGFTLAP